MPKNNTTSKTTFGDWSASYYIFKDDEYGISRDEFMVIFGAPNPLKKNRYSWSGRPTPKVSGYNFFGQILIVDKKDNIEAVYSFSEDKRPDKKKIVPRSMQKDNLVIARWDAEMMKNRVEDKFNKMGCY